jgi:polygalacturonase
VRFYGSSNITVQNLRIRNSPQTHLKFDSCLGITVRNISVSSPSNSPNTDGIHLQNTQNAEIHSSHISNGNYMF